MQPEDRKKVLEYVSVNPNSTEDDIAAALGMNIIDVLDVLHTLEKEGVLKSEDVALESPDLD